MANASSEDEEPLEKRTVNVITRTTLGNKERLKREAKRRKTTMTWITERCWEAYLPLLEAQKIEPLPKFPMGKGGKKV